MSQEVASRLAGSEFFLLDRENASGIGVDDLVRELADIVASPADVVDLFAALGDVKRLREMAECGVNLDAPNENGARPLHLAARYGQWRVVEFLVREGALVNELVPCVDPPLHEAVTHGGPKTATILIEGGANVNAIGHDGRTALHCAADWGHTEMAGLLLDKGADPAAQWAHDVAEDTPPYMEDWAVTPLHLAVCSRYLDMVKLLVSRGADIAACDLRGRTALDLAEVLQWRPGVAVLRPMAALRAR